MQTAGPTQHLATPLLFPLAPPMVGSHVRDQEALHYLELLPPSVSLCISPQIANFILSLIFSQVIPFQKQGKHYSLNSFLAWSEAGTLHPELEPALIAALKRVELQQDVPLKRKQGKTTRMVALKDAEAMAKKAVVEALKSRTTSPKPAASKKESQTPTSTTQPRRVRKKSKAESDDSAGEEVSPPFPIFCNPHPITLFRIKLQLSKLLPSQLSKTLENTAIW